MGNVIHEYDIKYLIKIFLLGLCKTQQKLKSINRCTSNYPYFKSDSNTIKIPGFRQLAILQLPQFLLLFTIFSCVRFKRMHSRHPVMYRTIARRSQNLERQIGAIKRQRVEPMSPSSNTQTSGQ